MLVPGDSGRAQPCRHKALVLPLLLLCIVWVKSG